MESRIKVAVKLQRFDYPDSTSLCALWQKIFLVTAESSDLVVIALGFGTRLERARDIHYRSFQRRSLLGTPRGILNGESIKYPLCEENDIASVTVCVCVCVAYRGMRE